MIIATVPPPDDLEVPAPVTDRLATTAIETLRHAREIGAPALGADLWPWCGQASPHRDRHLGARLLPTLSVRSEHGIGDALTDEPETPFPPGALALIDPSTVHWLVPSHTELADDAGRIRLPLWVGLQWEIPRAEAPARVRALIESLGGTWRPDLDRRYKLWVRESRERRP